MFDYICHCVLINQRKNSEKSLSDYVNNLNQHGITYSTLSMNGHKSEQFSNCLAKVLTTTFQMRRKQGNFLSNNPVDLLLIKFLTTITVHEKMVKDLPRKSIILRKYLFNAIQRLIYRPKMLKSVDITFQVNNLFSHRQILFILLTDSFNTVSEIEILQNHKIRSNYLFQNTKILPAYVRANFELE